MNESRPLNPWGMVQALSFPGSASADNPRPQRRTWEGPERTTRELPVIEEPAIPPRSKPDGD